jgi:hypothetical protein
MRSLGQNPTEQDLQSWVKYKLIINLNYFYQKNFKLIFID